MKKPVLYNALAEAFVAEGVDTQFILMGDGNMHWTSALAALPAPFLLKPACSYGGVGIEPFENVKVRLAVGRFAANIGDGDKRGEVLVLTPQAVSDPRAK